MKAEEKREDCWNRTHKKLSGFQVQFYNSIVSKLLQNERQWNYICVFKYLIQRTLFNIYKSIYFETEWFEYFLIGVKSFMQKIRQIDNIDLFNIFLIYFDDRLSDR